MEIEGESYTTPHIRFGVLGNADGSALYSHNGEEVLAAVSGPAPAKSKQEKIDTATIVVTLETLSLPPSLVINSAALRIERLLERIILGIMHPKTLIAINIQPMKLIDETSAFVTCFNAAICALMDAGIPLRSVAVAVQMGLNMEVVFEHTPSGATLLAHEHSGVCSMEELQKELDDAQQKSIFYYQAIQGAVHKYYSQ